MPGANPNKTTLQTYLYFITPSRDHRIAQHGRFLTPSVTSCPPPITDGQVVYGVLWTFFSLMWLPHPVCVNIRLKYRLPARKKDINLNIKRPSGEDKPIKRWDIPKDFRLPFSIDFNLIEVFSNKQIKWFGKGYSKGWAGNWVCLSDFFAFMEYNILN